MQQQQIPQYSWMNRNAMPSQNNSSITWVNGWAGAQSGVGATYSNVVMTIARVWKELGHGNDPCLSFLSRSDKLMYDISKWDLESMWKTVIDK